MFSKLKSMALHQTTINKTKIFCQHTRLALVQLVKNLNYYPHWAQTSRGSVEAHFDGPTAYGSDQAASRACFPQLEVPSTRAHRVGSVQLSLGSCSRVFPVNERVNLNSWSVSRRMDATKNCQRTYSPLTRRCHTLSVVPLTAVAAICVWHVNTHMNAYTLRLECLPPVSRVWKYSYL